MNITLFTKNSLRHNYLINSLAKICNNLFVIKENFTFEERLKKEKTQSDIKKDYFDKVNDAEKKIFKNKLKNNSNIKIKNLGKNKLSKIKLTSIKSFLLSDLYIVFGSSYIKGRLINFLIKNKAINIHMGISPYYRGSDCNFWAQYDNNLHMVGGTIHKISKGLDSGPIIYHALVKPSKNPFIYSMSAVKFTIDSLVKKIREDNLNLIKPIKQKKKFEIRYTKKSEFTDDVIKNFIKRKVKTKKNNTKKFFINPEYL